LVVHFNLDAAVMALAAVHTVLFVCELLYSDSELLLPLRLATARLSDGIIDDGCEFLPLCQTVGPIVFLLVLGSAHYVRKAAFLFLDICCISQDDPDAKSRGIGSIGAILDRSERMLALVSGDYFSRMWCVFEFAAYTRRAGASRIDIVPLHEPLSLLGFVLSSASVFMIQTAASYSMTLYPEKDKTPPYEVAIPFTVMMLPGLLLQLYAELQARQIRLALSKLQQFDLQRDATCFSDSDRDALLNLIAEWFTDTRSGETTPSRLRNLGVHRFERFVRFELAPQMRADGQTSGLLYSVAIVQVFALGYCLDIWAMPGSSVFEIWSVGAIVIYIAAVFVPLSMRILSLGSGVIVALRDRRVSEPIVCICGLCVTVFFNFFNLAAVFTVGFPGQWGALSGNPDWMQWHIAENEDGFENDAFGRRVRKWQIYMVFTCIALFVGRNCLGNR